RGGARLAERLDPLGHVRPGPDERDRPDQLVGHRRGGLVLLAVQVEVLDLLRLVLVAVAAGELVVEVLALGPHPADVQRPARAPPGRGRASRGPGRAARPTPRAPSPGGRTSAASRRRVPRPAPRSWAPAPPARSGWTSAPGG